MKKTLVCLLGILALVALQAGASNITGTKHDLSVSGPGATTNVNRVCVFCHTPHQATQAAAQDPLWNHTLSGVGSYGTYSSSTLNAAVADLGGAVAGSSSVSNLCMSCHDGTIAVIDMYNVPNETPSVTITAGGNVNATGFITGNPNVGTDLSDDHPVNFTYDLGLMGDDGELANPTTAPVSDLLFAGSVQCASCHDVHDNTYVPFMVMDNAGSALCKTCHVK